MKIINHYPHGYKFWIGINPDTNGLFYHQDYINTADEYIVTNNIDEYLYIRNDMMVLTNHKNSEILHLLGGEGIVI